ncbi:aminopeptidase [Vibrio sp. UCD-FRSSP16_10]|nr:aminopeptidase [Vibrio sp. UCD-FRSSP16_30]OBT18374.1 aminopeptidase [Vibrio sp. UCD-FRSSP16_10]
MSSFTVRDFDAQSARLSLVAPSFDHDSFPIIGQRFIDLISATIVEKQQDADLHSWLIDFEGCKFMLRAEHYSESMWLEALSVDHSVEELQFLAQLVAKGI